MILSCSSTIKEDPLSSAALSIVDPTIRYSGEYFKIDYPMGDVSPDIGVCTDVIIRAYRVLGIDLQKEIHEDILKAREEYWRVHKIDKNINHRRVPNIQVFLERNGITKPITYNAEDYLPGDIVIWKIGKLDHIGIVVNKKMKHLDEYMIVHNIGAGQVVNPCLFDWEIKGHYRY